jgi:hypothetical protein
MRGDNHLNICRYGSPLDGIRSIAFLAKSWSTVQMFEIDCTGSIWSRFRRLGFIKLLTCRIYSAAIASFLSLISGFSCRTMFNKDLWTSIFPLYSIKPNLRNLFIKKLTRDRVVPIISASIS